MLREPEGPAGKGLRLCLSWCRPFWRGKNSAMSNLVKKHHTRQEKYTVMLFLSQGETECRDSLALPPMPALGFGEVGL